MTSTDCPKLCFQRAPTMALRGAGSGFPQLVRETLSKNAMLPGLTYFYCNWVSQEERGALDCGVGKRGVERYQLFGGATSRKAREGAHPQLFRLMLKDKPALYFAVKVAHPPDNPTRLRKSL